MALCSKLQPQVLASISKTQAFLKTEKDNDSEDKKYFIEREKGKCYNTSDNAKNIADRLRLSKKQIDTLLGLRGLTLIPLKLYAVRGRVKLLVGIAKGKKKYDKREAIKKKDTQRARQRGIDG